MKESILLSEIKLNAIYNGRSGHAVFPQATLEINGLSQKVVYKKNKHGQAAHSQLEVGFTGLAELFLDENLTAPQYLVTDSSDNITGVVCQHLGQKLTKSVQNNVYFIDESFNLVEKERGDASQIPIYFFNQLPHNTFNRLLNRKKERLA